jgi:hypothetical protein
MKFENAPDNKKQKPRGKTIGKTMTDIEKKVKEKMAIFKAFSESPKLQEAKEIFGKNFLGPEAVDKFFRMGLMGLPPEKLRELETIPFSREILERAKQIGMMLVLRFSNDENGAPLTINNMRDMIWGLLNHEGSSGYTLGDSKEEELRIFKNYNEYGRGPKAWYDEEEFATKSTPEIGWSLVMKHVLPESIGKSWDDQEKILKEWAQKNNFDPNAVRRRTPVEATYDELIYRSTNTYSPLDLYDWTSVQDSEGRFVLVSDFHSDGIGFNAYSRDERDNDWGVCPAL